MLKFVANLLGYDLVKQERNSLELGGTIPPPKPISCHGKKCRCGKCVPHNWNLNRIGKCGCYDCVMSRLRGPRHSYPLAPPNPIVKGCEKCSPCDNVKRKSYYAVPPHPMDS